MELFQENLEQQLGAVCLSLAFQLFTWRDNALKIAISCKLRHHSAPNAVAFSLPSKAERGVGEEGITFFPSFLKAYIQWERDETAKMQSTLWEPCSDV